MINILMKNRLDEKDIAIIRDNFDVNIFFENDEEKLSQEILDKIEVYIDWENPEVMENMPNLKWIHLYSAGVDSAINSLQKYQTPPRLTNNSGAYSVQLSEHGLAFIMAFNRDIPKYVNDTRNCIWDSRPNSYEVCDSIVGIVGFGDVGSYSGKIFNALGAKVLAHKLNKIKKPDYVETMYYGNDGLDEMLPFCDYVVITLPGTEKTRNLFDRERMLKMKMGAVLTNVGRGFIIDCNALADLLNEGYFRGAGLDVTEPEPLPKGHKLWSAKNVIISPHMSGMTPGRSYKARIVLEKNLTAFIEGKKMPNEIDFKKGY